MVIFQGIKIWKSTMEVLTQRSNYIGTLLFSLTTETYEIAELWMLYFNFWFGCFSWQNQMPLERLKGDNPFKYIESGWNINFFRKERIILWKWWSLFWMHSKFLTCQSNLQGNTNLTSNSDFENKIPISAILHWICTEWSVLLHGIKQL